MKATLVAMILLLVAAVASIPIANLHAFPGSYGPPREFSTAGSTSGT